MACYMPGTRAGAHSLAVFPLLGNTEKGVAGPARETARGRSVKTSFSSSWTYIFGEGLAEVPPSTHGVNTIQDRAAAEYLYGATGMTIMEMTYPCTASNFP